jgi:flagellar motor switch protein FliN/FliY
MQQQAPINAQNVQFESFDGSGQFGGIHSDISLIRDVPLEISVELGRTTKRISEILDLTSGSVIELDRLVGESLDILANGKVIAKGEVVVVDENYGVRITEIVVPQHRLNSN